MLIHLSNANFWILVVGLTVAAVNFVASNPVALRVAPLFRRLLRVR